MTFSHFHFLKQHTCAVRAGPAAKPERSEAPSSENSLSVCVYPLSDYSIRLWVANWPMWQLPTAPRAPVARVYRGVSTELAYTVHRYSCPK